MQTTGLSDDVQRSLFHPEGALLDEDKFLSVASIQKLRTIEKNLKGKGLQLDSVSGITKDTWISWLYRRRRPADGAIAFLKLLIAQPDFVTNVLTDDGEGSKGGTAAEHQPVVEGSVMTN